MSDAMTRAELIKTFQRMASEIAEKDFSHVTEDAKIAQLGIDSLGMLELVGQMERELGVQIPDEQLVGIQTVRQLLDIVEKRVTK
jgi:acyl carrier protein